MQAPGEDNTTFPQEIDERVHATQVHDEDLVGDCQQRVLHVALRTCAEGTWDFGSHVVPDVDDGSAMRDARLLLVKCRCHQSWGARCLEESRTAWRSIQIGLRIHPAYDPKVCLLPQPSAITAAEMVASLDKLVFTDLAADVTSTNCIDYDDAIVALHDVQEFICSLSR